MSESKLRIPYGALNVGITQHPRLSSSRACTREHIKTCLRRKKKTVFGFVASSVSSSLVVISSPVAVTALSSSVAASTTAVSSAEASFLLIHFAA
jgi:hypothetical protein